MSLADHAGDAAADFAMVKMMASDPDRQGPFLRRRTAAVLWIPAMLISALAGGWSHSGVVAFGLLALLCAALFFYSERPRFLFRR